jgi:hypothetical protein
MDAPLTVYRLMKEKGINFVLKTRLTMAVHTILIFFTEEILSSWASETIAFLRINFSQFGKSFQCRRYKLL